MIQVQTWDQRDRISVVQDASTLLVNFHTFIQYTTENFDSAMLFTLVISYIIAMQYILYSLHIHICSGIHMNGGILGIAPLGTMCSRQSAGLTQDTGSSIAYVAYIAAHELGHIFNMEHDDGRK